MRTSRTLVVGASCALSLAVGLGGTPAHADLGPQAGDIVGVGSDTVQNIANFVTDGDTAQDPGFNNGGNKWRIASFDATADASDRAVYQKSSTSTVAATVILRGGSAPVTRPNGSSAGVAALIADTATPEKINFVRSSSVSAITGGATASIPLHAIKIATDDIVMVGSSGTNAVAVSGAELVRIYTCQDTDWGVAAGGAANGHTIVPLSPQTGSGTGKTFLADLGIINGSPVTYGACVQTVEENDATAFSGATATNMVAPFSSGRVGLYATGYLGTPPGLTTLYGTQTAGSCVAPSLGQTATYCRTRGLYIAWRANDDSISQGWEPGSTKNWVQTLFYSATGTPFIKSSNGQADIAAGGVTATYVDCGITTGSAFPAATGCTA